MSFRSSRPARVRRAAVGGALALTAVAAGVATAAPAGAADQVFPSRPDLRPTNVRVTTPANGTSPGLVFVAPKGGGAQDGSMIFDDSGALVWWRAAPKGQFVNDFRRQTYKGKPVLTFWEGKALRGYGYGAFVILDQNYREIARVSPGGRRLADFHEFTLTPNGTALLISYKPVRGDTRSVRGGSKNDLVMQNLVQEVDVETNRVVFEWDSTKAIAASESYQAIPARRGVPYDFVHANSVSLDADGGLLVSSRHMHTVYKVDRRTKKIVWRLGGKRSTFRFGRGARFRWQHDVHRQPDGTITVFDNATDLATAKGVQSRGLRLNVDERARTATLARQWTGAKPQINNTQGNLQQQPNGNVFVGWGGLGDNVSEFAPDGRMLFEARFDSKAINSYRAYRSEWSAVPTAAPRGVARRSGKGSTAIRVSWNGATGVTAWRVLGGPSKSALRFRQVLPRRGFETPLRYGVGDAVVVVEALDAAGNVMGRTSPVTVGSRY